MLNHLILNRLTLSLLLAFSLPGTLVGCQSYIAKDNTISTHSMATDSSTSSPISFQPIIKTEKLEEEIVVVANEIATEATTLQWASNYHWPLTQVKDKKNNAININTDTPITLDIAPSSLSLSQGCQHFAINLVWMSAPPFEYGSELREKASNCKTNPEKEIPRGDIELLFPRTNTFKLDIELSPLLINKSVNTQITTRTLVIKVENGSTLIFDGTPKTFKEPTGLPIDKALLERYDWQLVSAVRNTINDKGQVISRQPISDFYFSNHPISLEFRTSPDSPYIAFNSGCNGSSEPYFLLRDNTLNISNILSTAMNCGETGNRIETALFDLMRNSSSKLTLILQTKKPESKNQTEFPHYNLLQTMETGETLVWQNEIKKIP